MAKKGQKFNSYTKELKSEILKRYLDGESSGELAKEYGISSKTIRNWALQLRRGKDVLMDTKEARKGRPKKEIGEIDYKERYEILKKYQAFLKAQREKK